MSSELRIDKDKIEYLYQHNKLHRENGPALINSNGTKFWYKNGHRHRENGPTIIYPNGIKKWYKYGLLHRENGPAIIFPDKTKVWYIKGKLIKIQYEGKEYQSNYNPCELCIVKPICKQYCELKKLLSNY